MCELLIRNIDNTHPDPEKDLKGCYKKGDIVEVRPDGCEYGRNELSDRFRIVKLPNVPVEDMKYYMWHERKTFKEIYPKALFSIRKMAAKVLYREQGSNAKYARRAWMVDDNDNIVKKTFGGRDAINA